jgi:hypothetical protein
MKALWGAALCIALFITGHAIGATSPVDLTGRWEVTTSYPGGSYVAGLDLATDAQRYTGKSGYLAPDAYFYQYAGGLENDGLHLQILAPDGRTVIGNLVLTVTASALFGKARFMKSPLRFGRAPAKIQPTK